MLWDPHERVLSYHDVLLLKSDVDLLQGPEWLNDQVRLPFARYCCAWNSMNMPAAPPVLLTRLQIQLGEVLIVHVAFGLPVAADCLLVHTRGRRYMSRTGRHGCLASPGDLVPSTALR